MDRVAVGVGGRAERPVDRAAALDTLTAASSSPSIQTTESVQNKTVQTARNCYKTYICLNTSLSYLNV